MIDKNRKKSIDDLVNELKSKYDTKSLGGLRQLSKYLGISVIESNKPITCFAVWDDKKEQKYIFLKKDNYFKNLKLNNLAHELGHCLLHYRKDYPYLSSTKDEKEDEANYFAERLLNKATLEIEEQLNVFYSIITKPLDSFKYAFFNKRDDLKIFKEYLENNSSE